MCQRYIRRSEDTEFFLMVCIAGLGLYLYCTFCGHQQRQWYHDEGSQKEPLCDGGRMDWIMLGLGPPHGVMLGALVEHWANS